MPEEPKPPLIVSRSVFPGDDPHWRTAIGRAWLRDVFLPFYDGLSTSEQMAYCDRWKAPNPWVTLFLHPDIDEEAAQADAERGGDYAEALDFRKIFLGS